MQMHAQQAGILAQTVKLYMNPALRAIPKLVEFNLVYMKEKHFGDLHLWNPGQHAHDSPKICQNGHTQFNFWDIWWFKFSLLLYLSVRSSLRSLIAPCDGCSDV